MTTMMGTMHAIKVNIEVIPVKFPRQVVSSFNEHDHQPKPQPKPSPPSHRPRPAPHKPTSKKPMHLDLHPDEDDKFLLHTTIWCLAGFFTVYAIFIIRRYMRRQRSTYMAIPHGIPYEPPSPST